MLRNVVCKLCEPCLKLLFGCMEPQICEGFDSKEGKIMLISIHSGIKQNQERT